MTSISHAADSLKSMLNNLGERSSEIVERRSGKEAGHIAYDEYDAMLEAKDVELAA